MTTDMRIEGVRGVALQTSLSSEGAFCPAEEEGGLGPRLLLWPPALLLSPIVLPLPQALVEYFFLCICLREASLA